jgi:hypothetical protein
MPRRRFSQILVGARGETAKAKYLDRLRGMGQGENIGTKGNRPDTKYIYIEPFGADLPATVRFRTSALTPSWDSLKTAIGTRASDIILGTQQQIKAGGFKAARVVRRTKDTSGTVATSKLTGLKYLKYNSTSISAPFGRENATDSEGEAQTALRTAVGNTYKVSFVEERM